MAVKIRQRKINRSADRFSASSGFTCARIFRGGSVIAFLLGAPVASQQLNDGQGLGALSPTLSFRTDYFGYAASISPRIGYSDNIDLVSDVMPDPAAPNTRIDNPNKADDFIASTAFSGNAIYASRAFTGLVVGDVEVGYLVDGEDVNFNQRVAGVGTATLRENLFYFDVSGSTSRQLAGDNARFSNNLNAGFGQRTDVHTYSVSPYLNKRFGDNSAAEIRYRFSQVFVDDDNSDISGGILNGSKSQELALVYDTGDKFQNLTMRYTAYGSRTNEKESLALPAFEFERGTILAEAEYVLTDSLALTGSIGYDEIRSDAPADLISGPDLSGLNWLAGFRYRPGRRTDLLVQYGERFGDDYINANFRYQFSKRLSFDANAERQFRTRAQAVNSQFAISQRRILDFADRLRGGEKVSPNGLVGDATRIFDRFQTAQTIGVSASDVYNVRISGIYDRTQVGISADYADDNFGFRQVETIGGSGYIQRQFSRRLTGYADAFYRFADTTFDIDDCIAAPQFFGFNANEPGFNAMESCVAFAAENGETKTAGASIGLRYQFYRNLALFGEYSYTTRFSDEPLLEFEENFVQTGLILDL